VLQIPKQNTLKHAHVLQKKKTEHTLYESSNFGYIVCS